MLRRHFGAAPRPGAIVDAAGNEVGRHEGVHHFTIGQRRGLGVALGRPAWVKAIDADAARIVLTDDENELLARGLVADSVVWHGPISNEPVHCEVQVRYRHPPMPAVLEHREAGQAHVHFVQPIKAVTPGQAAVFYDGDRVLGGGIIERAREE
jgi:tRNA-specific 2-thiouridylase